MKEELVRYIEVDVSLFEKINDLKSKITIKVCHVGHNPNKTFFSKPSLEYLAQSVIGAPIIGQVNEKTGEFEGHNVKREFVDGKFKKTFNTRPYGYVPDNAKPRFQTFETKQGPLEYLVVDGILWNRYPEAIEAFEKNDGEAKQSMELHLNHTGYKVDDIYYFEEAQVTGLCLLGPKKTTGMIGAVATLFEMDEDVREEFESLKKEYETEEGVGMPSLKEVKEAAKKQMENHLNLEGEATETEEIEDVKTDNSIEETKTIEAEEVEETKEAEITEIEVETEVAIEEKTEKTNVDADEVIEKTVENTETIETTEVTEVVETIEEAKKPVNVEEAIKEFENSELYSSLPEAARKAIYRMVEQCQDNIRYLEACIIDAEAEKQRYISRMDSEQKRLSSEKATLEAEVSELQGALTTYELKEQEEIKNAKLEEVKPVLTVEEFESLEENRNELSVDEIGAAAAQFVLDRQLKTTYEAEAKGTKTLSVKARTQTPKVKKQQQSRYPSLNKYFSEDK